MEFPDTLETQITNKIMRIFSDAFGNEPVVHLQGAKYNRVFEHVHKTLTDFSLLSTGGSIGQAINTKSIENVVLVGAGRRELTVEDIQEMKEVLMVNTPPTPLPFEKIHSIKEFSFEVKEIRECYPEEKRSPIYIPKRKKHKRR
jgi:hypothetical protein